VESFQVMAKGLGSVTEMVILGGFPWCFTPELYVAKPEYVDSLAEFVRSRRCRTWTRSCASPERPSATTPRRSLAGLMGHETDRPACRSMRPQ
jgi:hypothetical protein